MSIQQNAALFSILGTTYGGNGIQTFGLPDLRGRVPIHWGQGPGQPDYVLGEISGTQAITVPPSSLPLHNHFMQVNNATPNAGAPAGNYLAAGASISGTSALLYTTNAANTTMSPNEIAPNGGNQPLSILQPYLTVNYVIALVGIFPSRN
jgi:microcystin-dependent protein